MTLPAEIVSPLVHGTRATFRFRGERARNVQLMADVTDWRPIDMVEDTDGWSLTLDLPADARAEYLFVVNGQAILDPSNPYTGPGGFGPRSECRMPDYRPPPAVSPPVDGLLERCTLAGRSIQVYVPAHPEGASVAVAQDGSDYVSYGGMPGLLDDLIHKGVIRPTLAVFVDPQHRDSEYRPNPEYPAWLADSLLPEIADTYGVSVDPAHHALIGASLGGLLAAWGALLRPDAFRLVGAQSPAFRPSAMGISQEALLDTYTGDWEDLRFHVDGGTLETILHREEYLPFIRRQARMIEERGAPVQYVQANEGHNWTTWRGRLPGLLTWLFAARRDRDAA